MTPAGTGSPQAAAHATCCARACSLAVCSAFVARQPLAAARACRCRVSACSCLYARRRSTIESSVVLALDRFRSCDSCALRRFFSFRRSTFALSRSSVDIAEQASWNPAFVMLASAQAV